MLEKKYLRLGNLVQDRDGNPCLVETLNEDGIKAYSGMITKLPLSPIPLTEEWLLKLGFNKEYKSGYIGIDFGNTDFVLSTPDNPENSTGKFTWFFRQGNVPMFKPIDFVHELQNLFFGLTNEELILC